MPSPLQLLLPALVPSWNFFEAVEASPRIEYALSPTPDVAAEEWREFRPRPRRLSFPAMLGRLFWNARWNETLFLVTCAERLLDEATAHSEDEIFRRVAADLADDPHGAPDAPWLSFRIVLVDDDGGQARREVAFIAAPRRRSDVPVR